MTWGYFSSASVTRKKESTPVVQDKKERVQDQNKNHLKRILTKVGIQKTSYEQLSINVKLGLS